jgi:hypothetical protein
MNMLKCSGRSRPSLPRERRGDAHAVVARPPLPSDGMIVRLAVPDVLPEIRRELRISVG